MDKETLERANLLNTRIGSLEGFLDSGERVAYEYKPSGPGCFIPLHLNLDDFKNYIQSELHDTREELANL